MDTYMLGRYNVIKQTVQNMIEAGVVKPEEQAMFTNQLQQLDPKDLLTALLDSVKLREQEPKRIKFYPIDVDAVSMN